MEAKQLLHGAFGAFAPSVLGAVRITSAVEATLPRPVSQKWVAHACRMGGVGKPRWNRHTCVWTTTGRRDDGVLETIVIRHGSTRKNVTIEVSWLASEGAPGDTATGRRLVTSLFTGMSWALRHEKLARTSLV